MLLRRLLLSSLIIALTGIAYGQEPKSLCADGDGFNDFDFWVGEWKVVSNDETKKFFGDNSITKHHGDCLIKENWRSAGGGAGFSINYFNSVTSEWRQVWVANGYSIDYTGGLNATGSMVLVGSIYDYAKNQASDFRGTWTPIDADNVLQTFEIFDAEKDAWQVWFEGLYVRQVTP